MSWRQFIARLQDTMPFELAAPVSERVSRFDTGQLEQIVEAHGGRLSLANREGAGASVTVWLPD